MSKNLKIVDKVDDNNQNIIPPDPTFQVTEFLSWLKKRGALRKLKDCENKWKREGLDIEKILNKFDESYIAIYLSRGEKVVLLKNKVWADQWMSHYDLEVPHHRHKKELEKIFSVTESKTKV